MAQAGAHATADAYQTNIGILIRPRPRSPGIGGDGGNWNAALGGSVGAFGSVGSDAIATGDNSAGNGGDGHFSGHWCMLPSRSLIRSTLRWRALMAALTPISRIQCSSIKARSRWPAWAVMAGTAMRRLAETCPSPGLARAPPYRRGWPRARPRRLAPTIQRGNHAGNGGDGYFYGSIVHTSFACTIRSTSPWRDTIPVRTLISRTMWNSTRVLIASGDNHAGNGGDGYFYGGIVHATFAFYDPINIAVAGYNSTANADQTNNVVFDQSAFQMAGVGGNGGNGNAAIGGDARPFLFHLRT